MGNPEFDTTISAKITKAMMAEATERAKTLDLSRSDFVRIAIQKELDNGRPTTDGQA